MGDLKYFWGLNTQHYSHTLDMNFILRPGSTGSLLIFALRLFLTLRVICYLESNSFIYEPSRSWILYIFSKFCLKCVQSLPRLFKTYFPPPLFYHEHLEEVPLKLWKLLSQNYKFIKYSYYLLQNCRWHSLIVLST